MSACGHSSMPAILPVSPRGSVTFKAPKRCEPSSRESLSTNGEYVPAIGLAVPALKLGPFGASPSLLTHAPPLGVSVILNDSLARVAAGLPLQGESTLPAA